MKINSLSIVTPIINPDNRLYKLIESIYELSLVVNIEWIVINGDKDTSILDEIIHTCKFKVKYLHDFGGFYSSLNLGVQQSEYEYYVCAGGDDFFYSGLGVYLKKVSFAIEPDFIAGSFFLEQSKKTKYPGFFYLKRRGISSVLSNHSIGILINKKLHSKYGYYSTKFKYLSDQLFCLSVIKSGAIVKRTIKVFGSVGEEGFSTKNSEAMKAEWIEIAKVL